METLSAILVWAVFGLIVGAIARLLYPGRQNISLFMTMLLGIVGSIVGGLIGWAFTGGRGDPFAGAGWIMSIIGAVIVVWAYMASMGGRTVSR